MTANNPTPDAPGLPVTDGALRDLIDWHKRDGTKKGVLTHSALVELLSARQSRPLPSDWVADGFVLIDKGAVKLVENVLRRAQKGEVADAMLSAIGQAMMEAAPSAPAEGGECNCASGRGSEHCVVHANAVWDQPQTAPEPLAQGGVLCHRIVSATHEGMSTGWYNGDVTEDERKYWENGGHRIERAYASPQPAADEEGLAAGIMSHFCNAIDNLNDMPISDRWARKWAAKAEYLIGLGPKPRDDSLAEANPPQPSASVGERTWPIPELHGLSDAADYLARNADDEYAQRRFRERMEQARTAIARALTTAAGGGELHELVSRWRSVSTAMDLEARLQCADELESLLGRGGK